MPSLRIGESDCESFDDGFLVQPVNALTSFSYVLVGLTIAGIAWRQRRLNAQTIVFAVLLAGIGWGSVAFHGPQPGGSRLMHDLPILLTAVFMLSHNLSALVDRLRSIWPAFIVGTVLALAVTSVSLDGGVAMTGLALIATVVTEVVVYRRRSRSADVRELRRWYTVIVGLAAIAGSTWLLGRTESPVCDPDGVFQFHGLWHLLSAVVFGLWWSVAFARSDRIVPYGAVELLQHDVADHDDMRSCID